MAKDDANKDTIESVGKETGFPIVTPTMMLNRLKRAVLVSIYMQEDKLEDVEKVNPERAAFKRELNKKIEALYKKMTGSEFDPKLYSTRTQSTFLIGPPGHGKTTAFKEAARAIAKELGLKYVDKFGPNYEPELNHLVFVTHQSAGESSGLTYYGVPYASPELIDGKEIKVLSHAIKREFTFFGRTAGGVLLFDDASNALKTIQDIQLEISQVGTYQSLDVTDAYIGYTGNLGSVDGTNASELSSALVSRVIPYYTHDTVNDFKDRAYEKYSDELGDMYVSNFLERSPNLFSEMPNGSKAFACPRTWEDLIKEGRRTLMEHGGRSEFNKARTELSRLIDAKLGSQVGVKFRQYMEQMLSGADPMAKLFIENEEAFDPSKFHSAASSQSSNSLAFTYQYAGALSEYFVNAVMRYKNKEGKKDPIEGIEKYVKRYGRAVLLLGDSEFAYSISHMKRKMAYAIDEVSVSSSNNKTRDLKQDIKLQLAKGILTSSPDAAVHHRDLIAETLSGRDKSIEAFSTAQKVAASRRKIS